MAEEKIKFPSDATQNFVEIDRIVGDTVILKNGALRAVLMVSGINFELKSEDEQDIITASYQDFLNSLDFTTQIIVHSRKINIDNYIKKMKEIKEKESNMLLKDQIEEYIKFIESFVKENEIMSKNFFVVVPYQSAGIEEVKKGLSSFLPFMNKKKKKNREGKEETLDQKITQLQRRVDQVTAGLIKVGLRVVRLNKDELMELYYNLYNPVSKEKDLS